MKYLNDFRNADLAQSLIKQIQQAIHPDKIYRLMEFCGGHTHTIFRYGIPDMLPNTIQLLHGPGCPVCVLPIKRINAAIELAKQKDTVLCSYGDMLRVPGDAQTSLLKAKSQGADVRMIYSPTEVIQIAQKEPHKRIIFFAVGFETTTPPTALILEHAIKLALKNLFIFCNHVLTPPAIQGILEPDTPSEKKPIDGLIGPGHVSVITGVNMYEKLSEKYHIPIVISGFEPLDLLHSILMLIKQINQYRHETENQYTRAVQTQGNLKAQQLVHTYFDTRKSFEWRGLGEMTNSALKIRPEFSDYDAEAAFTLAIPESQENKACECPAVLRGQKKPFECKLFNKPCRPENPLGSCMVSSEGACATYYTYQKYHA